MQNSGISKKNLADAFKYLSTMPEDFMADGREPDLPQEREGLDNLWIELPSNSKST